MTTDSSRAAIASLLASWIASLGNNLQGVTLFGSLAAGMADPAYSDVNLLVQVDPACSLADLRTGFAPVWQAHRERLRRGPWVVTADGLKRLCALRPNLAHLFAQGETLHGTPVAIEAAPFDAKAHYGHLANEAFDLSSLLVPLHLDVKTRSRRVNRLRRLARRLAPETFEPEVPDLHHLATLYDRLGALQPAPANPPRLPPDPPPLLPGLVAIYEHLDQLLLVFLELSGETLAAFDWAEIGARIAEDYGGVLAASYPQLATVVESFRSVPVALDQFELVWGEDVLAATTVTDEGLLGQLAWQAAHFHADVLPDAFLTAGNDDLGQLIHDLQNQLLSIRLRHELMRRLRGWPEIEALDPLPGREAPALERIQAIRARSDWWADYYFGRLQRATPFA